MGCLLIFFTFNRKNPALNEVSQCVIKLVIQTYNNRKGLDKERWSD